MSGSAFAVTHHAFSSGAGRTSDGNGSHASTLKSPSYTKSVSWQHYHNIIKITFVAAVLASPIAHAQWVTNTEDDLFSGGKKAMMLGEVSSDNGAIVFDCTKEKLSAAYVEMDKSTESLSEVPMDLIMKVDGNTAVKLDATLSRRNVQSLQIQSDDADQLKTVLKQLQGAKSKVLVGVQTKDGGNQHSMSANVSGSTTAVNSFIKACEINL
ncbi:hypothetical protein [Enterobacter roggenkampii]|uniref:hypothetical protein n=1 Tax=Enterobacter roggenkampii TaxID=1812935 RepID=UPI00321BECC9